MNPLFSIVVPVYNGQEYLQETLNSIFNQTYKNYELIIVDGGSTDNTLNIINRNMNKINRIISERDNGMYDALDKGFKIASGDYLCYINSDDRLLSNALEIVASTFRKNKVDLVFGNVNYISEKGDTIYNYKALNINYIGIKAIQRLPFAQQSAFWTKKIYEEKGGFDTSLKFVADSKFFLNICLDPKVRKVYINLTLGEFRLHNGSFSVGSTIKMKKENELMKKEFNFKPDIIKRLYYETLLKVINLKDIYKKKSYKGAKF